MTFTKSMTLRPPRIRPVAASGKNVVGAGDVVAHGLRSEGADEDRAGVLDPGKIGESVDGQVLGSEAIGEGLRLCNRFGYKYATA